MRFCIPEITDLRGAGLGNEMFAWAKSFLASRVLGARLLHPAWGLNPRSYRHEFGTSRFDWANQLILKATMPVVRFKEADYRATGKEDFEEAVIEFAKHNALKHRNHYVFSVGGMWGGFLGIRKARTFIISQLLRARNAVENLHSMTREIDPNKILIAVHFRKGDFLIGEDISHYRRRFNIALPLSWYQAVCRSIRRSLGNQVQFMLLTNATNAEFDPFMDEFNPISTTHLPHSACGDLLLLASADCLVCSVSSFSLWAAFLSEKAYLWFEPQMHVNGEFLSFWGHEPAQKSEGGRTQKNIVKLSFDPEIQSRVSLRGIPVGMDGKLPNQLFDWLQQRHCFRNMVTDPLFYGVVHRDVVQKIE